jgi:urate oxidase
MRRKGVQQGTLKTEATSVTEIVGAHYGKASIPVMKIGRDAKQHTLFQAVVSVDTEGERIVDAYSGGDNSAIVPTDTMKNLIYALTFAHEVTSLEDLARHLGGQLLRRYSTMSCATISIEEVLWEPIVYFEPSTRTRSPISFRRRGGERDYTRVAVDRQSVSIESGTRDLALLKTSDSAFSGYVVDEFTTLPETDDRVLATAISGSWKVPDGAFDYRLLNQRVKDTALEVFATFNSRSAQHLAHEMGKAILDSCEDLFEISLALPNLHCNLIDLSPFGLDNQDTLYVPTDAPYGNVHVTMRR